MTPSELKYNVEKAGQETYVFSRKTMKFFGDTMKNYGVCSAVVRCNYDENGDYVEGGKDVECWELYRKRPVKHGLQSSAYFDKVTFKRVFESKGD